ncbi:MULTISPECIES: cheVAW transcriptional regulator CheQ [unclassified Campylobacter]|uniref:cheVAW transcriptional regulator CheQ n=1 Tax=unclassified Campylobacter TaxID=2593542 RepID=UPI0012383AE7|nr:MULTISPECIES: cheVAW transcriptional regulator CheQ [unclassified Campylobacter]KAA6227289.1 cysteine permease [Campylobacter sp. LR286c]KAA6227837.1 cysteine permease [Campylobacter sp. LR185c]KAA6228245.1 cysteine permease [Campylobacter sp. LR196d]KAA6229245.1 cysteine permease [Campylobacter sp. LR291e]KAA8604476.1 cysteine permease [Campylobacter sp. LR185c]
MTSLILPPNEFLDNYILNAQFHKLANISKNAYKFWKKVQVGRYQGTRIIFLHKNYILEKHKNALLKCDDLSGYVLASAFCSFTTLAPSHLVAKNNSAIYKLLDIKELCGIKFVNLKAFYDFLGLEYNKHIYIEKCHFFSPAPFEKRIKITDTMCVGYY